MSISFACEQGAVEYIGGAGANVFGSTVGIQVGVHRLTITYGTSTGTAILVDYSTNATDYYSFIQASDGFQYTSLLPAWHDTGAPGALTFHLGANVFTLTRNTSHEWSVTSAPGSATYTLLTQVLDSDSTNSARVFVEQLSIPTGPTTSMKWKAAAGAAYQWNFPVTVGTAGYVWQHGATTTSTWAAPPGGASSRYLGVFQQLTNVAGLVSIGSGYTNIILSSATQLYDSGAAGNVIVDTGALKFTEVSGSQPYLIYGWLTAARVNGCRIRLTASAGTITSAVQSGLVVYGTSAYYNDATISAESEIWATYTPAATNNTITAAVYKETATVATDMGIGPSPANFGQLNTYVIIHVQRL